MGRPGWLAGLVLILGLMFPGTASAHAYLVKALPVPDSTVSGMPARVQLWFSDPVEPRFADVFVLAPEGQRVASGPLAGDPKDATSLILPVYGGGSGTYVVEWRVVSADGHPVAGNYSFSVGAPSGTAQPTGGAVSALPPIEGISRLFQWSALLILPGLIGFWRTLARHPGLQRVNPAAVRRVTAWWAILALMATLFRLPVETHVQASVPWSEAWRPDQWLILLKNSTYGTILAIQLPLLLVVAGVAWRKPAGSTWTVPSWRNDGWLVPAFAALLVMAFAGHASDRPDPGLSMALDMVHLAAASWWVGGLTGVVLWAWAGRQTLPRGDRQPFHDAPGESRRMDHGSEVQAVQVARPRLEPDGARFRAAVPAGSVDDTAGPLHETTAARPSPGEGTIQPVDQFHGWPDLVRTVGWGFALSVVALVVTGLQATWVMTPTVYSLMHTTWGQALMVKIAFVVIMVALAVVHGLPLARLMHTSWIKGTVSAEWLLGLGAAVCVSVLTTSAPAYTDPGPVHRLLSQAAGTAELQIVPNRAGMNHLVVIFKDSQDRPLTDLEVVQVSVSMPDMGVTQVQVRSTAPGRYEASGSFFSMAGRWRVDIHALTREYRDLEWSTSVPVGQ